MACYQTASGLFVCGEHLDEPHCADCMDFADYLCDYPVGDNKTCDRHLCEAHATEVAPEIHYCTGHLSEYRAFVAAGGVRKELRNVVAFKPFKEPPDEP